MIRTGQLSMLQEGVRIERRPSGKAVARDLGIPNRRVRGSGQLIIYFLTVTQFCYFEKFTVERSSVDWPNDVVKALQAI